MSRTTPLAGPFDADFRRRFVDGQRRWRAFLAEAGRWRRVEGEVAALGGRWPVGGERPGALFGVAVGVKDVFRVEGLPTRAGSRLPAAVLGGAEAEAVRRLRAAGAVVLGKTVTTEFAYYEPGPTRNPRAPGRTPGGSSSGSAAAVAAGLVPLALGTQTIGSICRPAAFCGVVGFKPSFGRVPTAGLIPLAPSYDHVGVLAANVEWARRAAAVLLDGWRTPEDAARVATAERASVGQGGDRAGVDGRTSVSPKTGGHAATPEGGGGRASTGSNTGGDSPAAGRRPHRPTLGVPVGPYLEAAEAVARHHLRAVQRRLLTAGWPVREVPAMADFAAVVARHHRLVAAEAAAVHREWFDTHGHLYRPRSADLVERGRRVPAEEVEAARQARFALRGELEGAMTAAGVDLWLSPAAPGPPPVGLGATGDPVMNLPWTQAGLPTVALPAGTDRQGLPLGVQLTARFGEDEALLAWAAELAPVLEAHDD
jgi:Asp-tRNA(Asn)/Glu-tRNA(Gln) amidotransferase A subunit family amidase